MNKHAYAHSYIAQTCSSLEKKKKKWIGDWPIFQYQQSQEWASGPFTVLNKCVLVQIVPRANGVISSFWNNNFIILSPICVLWGGVADCWKIRGRGGEVWKVLMKAIKQENASKKGGGMCLSPWKLTPPMHEEWKGNWMIMFFGFKLSIPIWPPHPQPQPLQLWVCPHLHFLLWWIISTAYMCICDGRYGLGVSGHEQELAMLLPLCHLTRTIFTHLIACPLFSFFLFSFLY